MSNLQEKVDLSMVIPSYNTKDLLADCISSIAQNPPTKQSFEIIVVDNASSDGTVEMLHRLSSKDLKLKIISNKKNLGFARAVNQGWKKAQGKFVLFLNSDTMVKKDALGALASYAEGHKDVGAISGKLILRNGKLDPDCHRGFPTPWSSLTFFLGLESIFPKSRVFAQYHQGWKNKNAIHEIDAGAGALLLVKRDVLEEIGGWDENYFFYGEDLDLCYRIKQAGYKIVFHPKAEVVHYKGASSGLRKESRDIARPKREDLAKVTKGSIDAWRIFYNKFYKDKYPGWVAWVVLSGIGIKGAFRLMLNKLR